MLDDAYVKNAGNVKVMGGIVGIWAKMSADALLRDKLLKEGKERRFHCAVQLSASAFYRLCVEAGSAA